MTAERRARRFEIAGKRIFVAGHDGMLGAAVIRRLASERCALLTASREEPDLTRQDAVEHWFRTMQPDAVILAAGKVDGFLASDTFAASFLCENLVIASNVIHAAHAVGVAKLVFVGSSSTYPRSTLLPICDDAPITAPLDASREWYAVARIAAVKLCIKLCEAYRREHGANFVSARPTNIYGPHDRFDAASWHVLPALMRKFHRAKTKRCGEVTIWDMGTRRQGFLHVDDCADALVRILETYSAAEPINVGSGEDLEIGELARRIAAVVGYQGRITTDPSKSDGPARKLTSSDKLAALGWRPRIGLEDGLRSTYAWYLATNTRQETQ